MQYRDIIDEEQLIAVIEEIRPASTSELIRVPHPRCAFKGIKKAAVFTMFGNLEISKRLGVRHEHSVHLAVVGPKICLARDGAVPHTTLPNFKNASELGWKNAAHHESVTLQ